MHLRWVTRLEGEERGAQQEPGGSLLFASNPPQERQPGSTEWRCGRCSFGGSPMMSPSPSRTSLVTFSSGLTHPAGVYFRDRALGPLEPDGS